MKLTSLQFLRAIAAWLVVMHHYNQAFFSWNMDPSIFGSDVGYFLKNYGKLGVDIFFVISGFIMFYSLDKNRISAREFFAKRVIRIVPSYWFYTFIYIILGFLCYEQIYSQWNIESLLKSLFFISSNNPAPNLGMLPYLTVGWTLNFEMFFYLLITIALAVVNRWAHVVVILAIYILLNVWDKNWMGGYILTNPYMKEFAIGMIIGLLFCKNWLPKNNLIALSILILSSYFFWLDGAQAFKYQAVFLLVSGMLCLKDKLFENKVGKFISYLGDISFATYLAHVPIIAVLLYFFGDKPIALKEIIVLTSYIIGIFCFSAFTYKWIEKGKLNLMFKALIYRIFAINSESSLTSVR